MEDPRHTLVAGLRLVTNRWAKLFFTYVERATLVGVLYAITPAEALSSEWSWGALLHWQAWLMVVGVIALVFPLYLEAMILIGMSLRKERSLPARVVRWTGLAIVVVGLSWLATGVAFSIAKLLGDLAK